MNNSVFGKAQENLRNHVNVELVTDARLLRKRVVKPTFCRGKPITDCHTEQSIDSYVESPYLCRITVLELSKLHMYDFHYNHMKVKYPHANQLPLLFTDTDSLAYAVQTDDIYKDMAADAVDRYDFSEYPLDHPLYDDHRKAFGFFKDVLNSVPMQEFVGLRPKCYAFLCTGKVDENVLQHTRPVEKKTAKGVKRKVKDDHLHFARYLDMLRSFTSYVCKQNLISSSAHTIRIAHTRTIGLTAFVQSEGCVKILCILIHMVIRIPCQIQSIWTLLTSVGLWSALQMQVYLTVMICLDHRCQSGWRLILILNLILILILNLILILILRVPIEMDSLWSIY